MSFSFNEYISKIAMIPIVVIQEEALNVLLLVAVSKLLSKRLNKGWLIFAVVLSGIVFGGLHFTAWGMESAVSRMLIHIPFLFSVLYYRNAWPCVLAHMYQNTMTYTSVLIEDFSEIFVSYGLLLFLTILAYRKWVSSYSRHS